MNISGKIDALNSEFKVFDAKFVGYWLLYFCFLNFCTYFWASLYWNVWSFWSLVCVCSAAPFSKQNHKSASNIASSFAILKHHSMGLFSLCPSLLWIEQTWPKMDTLWRSLTHFCKGPSIKDISNFFRGERGCYTTLLPLFAVCWIRKTLAKFDQLPTSFLNVPLQIGILQFSGLAYE